MVTLLVPRVGEDRYIRFRQFLIGPFDQFMKHEGEVVILPSRMSKMTQFRGIHHENFVEHTKVSGDIEYHPILVGSTKVVPTETYPYYSDRVDFPITTYLGNPSTFTVNSGLAIHHATALHRLSATVWQQHGIEKNDDGQWVIYFLAGTCGTSIKFTEAYTYAITSMTNFAAGYASYQAYQQIYLYPSASPGDIDWTVKQPFDVIKSKILSMTRSSGVARSVTDQWAWARVPLNTVFNPSTASEHIDAIFAQLSLGKFPLELVPYGDLAMAASEKISANRVNMIAFLRDLRHPTEMIPKLRNLRKLKTLADNYLTVNYGVLPTISDIKEIIGSFKRIAPYVDRNGFSTYSAKSTADQVIGSNTYTLEQRIKVAIGDEDDGFQYLIQRLESMGTLPTFNNLWDLVPYSFVLDWFIDVGGFLERIDTCLRLTRLNILYATMSKKMSISGPLVWDRLDPYVGTVKWEHYHRWVSDQCPVPPLSLKTTFQEFGHWLESSALFIQRAKR